MDWLLFLGFVSLEDGTIPALCPAQVSQGTKSFEVPGLGAKYGQATNGVRGRLLETRASTLAGQGDERCGVDAGGFCSAGPPFIDDAACRWTPTPGVDRIGARWR
jgi:hypothetical protein